MRPSATRRETVRTPGCRAPAELYRHTCRPAAPAVRRGHLRTWSRRARCRLPRRDRRAVRAGHARRQGGREAGPRGPPLVRPPRRTRRRPPVIFSVLAAALAVAAVVYLVIALVRPEKF
uniref:potassium-transporting ATPase subunit F n=1 Tax=Microbacterium sp. SORGH_AS_1204 TaxID=3041785 RepID=UPI0027D889CD|nr:potassium-transporting ATPase subunit F [Microbacterium sp. SORGH_AS_1204]